MGTFQFTTIEPDQLQAAVAEAVKGQLENYIGDLKKGQQDELLTREDAAKFLKVSISTVNNWKKAGKLIAHGIGNRVYYWRSELEKSLVLLEP
jgi:hypothetical protein